MLMSVLKSKLFRILILICLIVPFISISSDVSAQEAFYINDYNVTVISNTDNSFEITEDISLYFTEERRGILRAIPKMGGEDRYAISDINVEGDMFSIEHDSMNTIIRIGNPNREISGSKNYKITYTLTFNKDSNSEHDMVYLNLIGNAWDTQINNASMTFYFPEDTAKLDEYKVFAGRYGSVDESILDVNVFDDRMEIKTNRALNNFEGVTLQAFFPENTFRDAQELPDPYSIDNYSANIDVRKDKSVEIVETFDASIFDLSVPFYHYIPLELQDGTTVQVRKIKLNGNRIPNDSVQGTMPIHIQNEGNVVLEYTLYYPRNVINPDLLQIYLFGNYREISISEANVSVKTHTPALTYDLILSVLKSNGESNKNPINESTTINFTINETLGTGVGIYLDLDFPENSFKSVIKLSSVLIILFGIFILFFSWLMYNKYGKDKIVSPVIEFYPPEGLSSGAIGYLINKRVNPIDISSMLLYWASHNHIHFVSTGKKDFHIKFHSALDSAHPSWEQSAFNELVKLMSLHGNKLERKTLQKEFYKVATKIRPSIPLYFRKSRSLNDPKSLRISALISLFAAILIGFVSGMTIFGAVEQYGTAILAGGVIGILSFVYFALFATIRDGWYKRKAYANFFITAGTSILFLIISIVYLVVMSFLESTFQFGILPITLIIMFIVQIIAVFAIKRSDYGHYILERIIGFKEFIKVAEKERLEALLNDDPEYYYHILPFALVLDVSNIWEKKFAGFNMQEPSWYEGNYMGYAFSYGMITSFAHSTASSLTRYQAPPSSSGTGGFSGGGGGFSGGGGGGGGGSSW